MSRALRRGGAGLATLVVLAGCGGASSKAAPTAQIIVQATTGTKTASFVTIVHAAGDPDLGFDVRGGVDFEHQRGELTVRPLRPPAAHRNRLITERWIGDRYYATGEIGILGNGGSDWTLVDTAKAAAVSPCLAHGDALAALGAAGASDPSKVLDALRKRGIDLQRVGSDTIRGASTTHWRAAPTDWPVESCRPRSDVHTKVRVGVDIWVDAHEVARRIELSQSQTTTFDQPGENGTQTSHQTSTTTTDFSDFGAPVVVNPPPPDLVHDGTAAFIAVSLGPGTAKSSDWHVAARSADGWRVFAAHTTTGWECYDVRGTPEPDGFVGISSDAPKHDGHSTACEASGALATFNGPVDVLVNQTEHSVRTVVVAVTGIGSAGVEFADRTTEPLAPDPHTLLATITGPAARPPVRIRVGSLACRVDGRGSQAIGHGFDAAGRSECLGAGPT